MVLLSGTCDVNVPSPGNSALDAHAGHTPFYLLGTSFHLSMYPVDFRLTFALCECEPRDSHAEFVSEPFSDAFSGLVSTMAEEGAETL